MVAHILHSPVVHASHRSALATVTPARTGARLGWHRERADGDGDERPQGFRRLSDGTISPMTLSTISRSRTGAPIGVRIGVRIGVPIRCLAPLDARHIGAC